MAAGADGVMRWTRAVAGNWHWLGDRGSDVGQAGIRQLMANKYVLAFYESNKRTKGADKPRCLGAQKSWIFVILMYGNT